MSINIFTASFNLSLSITTPYNSWISLNGTIKNNFDEKVDYLKINVTVLDTNKNIIHSDWTYLIGSDGLGPKNQTSIEIHSFPKQFGDAKYLTISKSE